ncbi:hypothetical protein, partial [Kocuria salsicia]|uniref:hypothetical protein n=1 Tax=Kocuria salsicia TaxID=664639 RepID=UPI001C92D31D
SKRRLDAMLSDWGVYHLHLGEQKHSRSRYVERTRDLLFLLVGADDAWLTDSTVDPFAQVHGLA